MRFEVRPAGSSMWEWVLLNEVSEVLAESHRTFPSETQAQAAALAWSQMVTKAARSIARP